jgi:hypothetical protein
VLTALWPLLAAVPYMDLAAHWLIAVNVLAGARRVLSGPVSTNGCLQSRSLHALQSCGA